MSGAGIRPSLRYQTFTQIYILFKVSAEKQTVTPLLVVMVNFQSIILLGDQETTCSQNIIFDTFSQNSEIRSF